MQQLLFQGLVAHQPSHTSFEAQSRAMSRRAKFFYLIMYFLPGILVFVLINVSPVYEWIVNLLPVPGAHFQLFIFLFVTYLWHMLLPIVLLKTVDKLVWKDVWRYLGLHQFDWKGVFLILPFFFFFMVLISRPYLLYIGRPVREMLDRVSSFQIPQHSLFRSYEALFNWPSFIIVLMIFGNLVGEELYFRGYLMKKSAFLGKHNVWLNGLFFSIYHFWQIPQTWPLFGLSVLFSLFMAWRKNLYPLIILHGLLNFFWPQLYFLLFKSYPFY